MRGETPVDFVYHDYGSLVSLSRYSTVGSLMGGLIGGKLAIEEPSPASSMSRSIRCI